MSYSEIHREDIARLFDRHPAAAVQAAVTFALLTIQQAFETVETQIESFKKDGTSSHYLWGSKDLGVAYVVENADRLAALLRLAKQNDDTIDAIDTLLEIPGLGIIKAGFVAQLLGLPDAGCIDTHNARIYDVDLEGFRFREGGKASTRIAKISTYVHLCKRLGGSESLWDVWCEYVAALRPKKWDSAWDVSRYHVDCVAELFGHFHEKYDH